MADRLLVEIEMLNDEADDAVFALIYLANSLAVSPTIDIRDDHDWQEHLYDTYKIKWRFAEDETRDAHLSHRPYAQSR
jgi:hypothetical protein